MPEAAVVVVDIVDCLEILSSYRYPVNMLWMCLLMFCFDMFRDGPAW